MTQETDAFMADFVDEVAELIRMYLADDPEKGLDVDELVETEACKKIMCSIVCEVVVNLVGQGKLEMRDEGGNGHFQCYLKR